MNAIYTRSSRGNTSLLPPVQEEPSMELFSSSTEGFQLHERTTSHHASQELTGSEETLGLQKRRRRVRFHPDSISDNRCSIQSSVVCQLPSLSDLSLQERSDTWFQPEEYAAIKSTAKAIAGSIREGHCVGTGQSSRTTYTRVMQQVYGKYISSREPNRSELKLLNMWVSAAHSRRGLEVLSVPGICKERDKQRRRVIEQVLAVQQNYKKTGQRDQSETVRANSERLTLPSKKFAYALGNADALAAGRPGISMEDVREGGRSESNRDAVRGLYSGETPEGVTMWG